MKTLILIIVFILSFFAITSASFAMKCNSKIVDEGDDIVTLYKACGSPDYSTMDVRYYKQDGGMTCGATIVNDHITHIDCNRG
jgi:hypothetical protein